MILFADGRSPISGFDKEVCAWVARRMPWIGGDFGPARGIGVARGGRLAAGIVYSNYRSGTIEAAVASEDPGWCRKGVLTALFDYPFRQLGCRRISCIVPVDNHRSLKLCQGIGWTEEGRVRDAFGEGWDGILFGMLRRECRWLRKDIR